MSTIPNPILVPMDVASDGQTVPLDATANVQPMPHITIGDVEKGEEASATMTGTSTDPVLNLVLPKGDKGDKGDKGNKGDKGDKGDMGELADGSVTTDKLADGAVTHDKLAEDERIWHKTRTAGLVHPEDNVWADNAGGGFVFSQTNQSINDSPDYVMRDSESAVTTGYGLFLPSLTIALASSFPAGSTSYVLNASITEPNIAAEVLRDIPFGSMERGVGAKLPTAVTVNEDNKIVLTFAETLNPKSATRTLMCAVKLNHSIYGGVYSGAGLSLKGTATIANGFFIKSNGSYSHISGRYINNSGGDSFITGGLIRNGGARVFIAGKCTSNAKNDVTLLGIGHNVTDQCHEGLFACGFYSDVGTDTLFAVGNGVDNNNRSNAFEIKDTGEVLIGVDPTENNGVATKRYVDGLVGNIETALSALR